MSLGQKKSKSFQRNLRRTMIQNITEPFHLRSSSFNDQNVNIRKTKGTTRDLHMCEALQAKLAYRKTDHSVMVICTGEKS